MNKNPIIETELGEEKLCSKCGDFWPMDSEFFFSRLRKPNRNGVQTRKYDAVCKACYELIYRKRTSSRVNNIRSKAEKMVAA